MSPAAISPLSDREEDIVELLRLGLSNKEIAFELGLAEGTVKEYLFRIFRKTGASNRVQLAVRAERRSLLGCAF